MHYFDSVFVSYNFLGSNDSIFKPVLRASLPDAIHPLKMMSEGPFLSAISSADFVNEGSNTIIVCNCY